MRISSCGRTGNASAARIEPRTPADLTGGQTGEGQSEARGGQDQTDTQPAALPFAAHAVTTTSRYPRLPWAPGINPSPELLHSHATCAIRLLPACQRSSSRAPPRARPFSNALPCAESFLKLPDSRSPCTSEVRVSSVWVSSVRLIGSARLSSVWLSSVRLSPVRLIGSVRLSSVHVSSVRVRAARRPDTPRVNATNETVPSAAPAPKSSGAQRESGKSPEAIGESGKSLGASGESGKSPGASGESGKSPGASGESSKSSGESGSAHTSERWVNTHDPFSRSSGHRAGAGRGLGPSPRSRVAEFSFSLRSSREA
mmetsp:Transcript_9596/g.24192  ORF Transcript_9596/g.24192 Transcript_9596/m.24192 type:complete len:314 (-) Transcript_9596:240-1181(-)